MTQIVTPDICDAYPEVAVCDPIFVNYGGQEAFFGPVKTVKCFEDNSLVKQAVAEPGDGAVLVVDAGGSTRCAMLGDMLAEQAAGNGWAGVIMYGCVRDVDILAETDLGIQALGAHPRKSEKRGEGQRDVPVAFAGVDFAPGQWVYADNNGILVAESRLELD
ncbi:MULTISPECIES: ribonuclease E activity regulator RraA [Halomonas]|jgi:regulator of ribonuclease activity A|uniref:4-hydroxy-4-methyl-2-oxoglutarate aldolase n=3 Tax=Halomonas TaxID=2745 RepID=A0AAU7KNR7_9GAMM|nr:MULTISPECIES: ribonuclease E activity regulator RraA [Halomonas]MBR9769784.1 RraA family protein [Gammaproteobacteria bacterium]KJZ05513.1 ribonuclease activity regulator protein RraA [Halomonas sp. S2151]MAR74203.1 ribonuclease activity regulator protein RraA [Halomonas sp.]MBR9879055.1 RraA family protein [Gammaproteobacteria bacterium]MBS8270722.1 RraA family protein [Halomonas litopenaei]|tara:strand:- start:81 stop:566 length:486 start_codon:yes stop_codon:yes gene_type:complete